LFEAGHVMQNAYLICTAMDLGICSVGGFLDDKINDLLNIDGINESALYLGVIGNIKNIKMR
jgi:SagB-type dehydrogenase family enzyme